MEKFAIDPLDFGQEAGPLYRQLADQVAEMIDLGALAPGDRLPPQRDIARDAGVNMTTVTRAFALLQRQGLVESRPGRGSVVSAHGARSAFGAPPESDEGFVDLSVTRPATDAWLRATAALLPDLPRDPRFADIGEFHPPQGPVWARTALAGWLAPVLGGADPDGLILTGGAQHGLACALAAIARPGDVVLAEAVGYHGLSGLCAAQSLTLASVAQDEGGMRPDALDAACRAHRPRAVFLTPCLQNPTTVTLSAARRADLAAIARRHGTLIVEDDVYRPLAPDAPPPIAAAHRDATIYIVSLSKCASPGARFGVVAAPPSLAGRIAAMLRVDCWSAPALTALIATRLIEDGRLDAIIAEQREELERRRAALARAFGPDALDSAPGAPHAWLRLSAPWRGEAFVRAARQAGVGLLPGAVFSASADGPLPEAARISLSGAGSVARVERAAGVLRRLFDTAPELADVAL
ncbi:aminotransferase-like domain-containing protein [Rubrimonas sp.]|uniref:aminotransferase-like domain-containing protein n=1 Tax=Rubrimonas sp. TaxID=2036015 RepID=UPI002FDE2D10